MDAHDFSSSIFFFLAIGAEPDVASGVVSTFLNSSKRAWLARRLWVVICLVMPLSGLRHFSGLTGATTCAFLLPEMGDGLPTLPPSEPCADACALPILRQLAPDCCCAHSAGRNVARVMPVDGPEFAIRVSPDETNPRIGHNYELMSGTTR